MAQPKQNKTQSTTNENIFLAEILAGKTKWDKVAETLEQANKPSTKERAYAQLYKDALNMFTEKEE